VDTPLGAPLAGVRVLDLSAIVAGPICGRVLADLGAEVVKVEAPKGDGSRLFPPGGHDDGDAARPGPYFSHMNAGKRDVCIDVRTDEGAALVARLAERCDVLLENFRPGVLERRGLGADALLARNPGLVYCSITGFGVDGPWVHRRVVAPVAWAEAGRVELDARMTGEAPRQPVHVEGDLVPGFMAVSAVLAALFQRERTGRGQHLDVAMTEAVVYADEWASTDLAGYDGPRMPDQWTYPVVTVGDGTQCALVGDPTRFFATFAAALSDADDPIAEPADRNDAMAVIRRLCAAMPDFETLEARLAATGNMAGRVRSVSELAETEWAARRGLFSEIEPGTRVTTAPFRSRHADIGVRGPAPARGEHTRAVLAELLDLSPADLEALQRDGVIEQQ
jgi:crotonobetainyl-CoA:carnitine CoA-transferase CaiB-like acyl-CoA transferase